MVINTGSCNWRIWTHWEALEHLHPQWMSLSNASSGVWGFNQNRRLKYCNRQRWWLNLRKPSFPDTTGQNPRTNSQRLWRHEETFPSGRILAWRRGNGHKLPPLKTKVLEIDIFWEGENVFSPMEYDCVYQRHSRANPMSWRSWSTQNAAQDFLCANFVIFWFIGFFFNFFLR